VMSSLMLLLFLSVTTRIRYHALLVRSMACNKLTNINRKSCITFWNRLINLLYHRYPSWGHSCDTGWNKHHSSYYSKQNSKFYLYYLQVYDK
jgi:hypothetical protein